jgi:uptake hydrogenase large subunit
MDRRGFRAVVQDRVITDLEGRIEITVLRRDDRVDGITIASTRRPIAQKLLTDRTPEQAAELAGRIFSLCGRAQRIAAEAACEAAAGVIPDITRRTIRERQVLAELAREHAWCLLVGSPDTGQAANLKALMQLREAGDDPGRLIDALSVVLTERLLGEPPEHWLGRDEPGMARWRLEGGTSAARFLAELDDTADVGVSQVPLLPPLWRLEAAGDLARRALDEAAFCAQPAWDDRPAETGAVARVQDEASVAGWLATRGRGAGARMLARLVELARLPTNLRGEGRPMVRAWNLGPDSGVACIETSRGLLLHAVRLRAGRVAEYRIIAPTEWNFHPAGALADGLATLPADGMLETRARLLVQSLDPCVDYAVEVRDA